MSILLSTMISIFLLMVMVNLFTSISSKSKNKKQKKIDFECGFNSMSKNRLPFSTQFFLITILFLIFDLEISILMPIINEKTKMNISINMIIMTLVILTMGLVAEWTHGMVEWSK